MPRARIEAGVASGHLRRVRVGWYAWSGADSLVAQTVALGGALSGAHALAWYGGWVPHAAPVHVWFSGRVPELEGVRIAGEMGPCSVVGHSRPRMPAHVLGEGVVPFDVALAHFLRSGCELVDRVAVVATLRRAWSSLNLALPRGSLRRQVLALSNGARIWRLSDLPCENGFEFHVATLLRLAGFSVVAQHRLPSGRRLDLLVEGCLGIELDGRDHYSGMQHRIDVQKGLEVTAEGLVLLRLSYWQVMNEWPAILEAITRLLRRL